ncbi:beta-galactosidase [Kibdelosporangium persicum]|uniref:Beta-galactosidase n=1 Tax=Kibdelosporangium persicum TaxID=2698649 RepID=A0ABX2FFQ6_9PSEU|nr:beta-galactosidase [Kibdelosporangium persicum]NRN69974.1 Beta-galactosidase [Kibdelosporangium persicum]
MRWPLDRFAFGGDYNPEQWPEEVWAQDMDLMRQAGVSLVSVGIFSWAEVEPRPGDYDFGWFDRVLDNLADAGVAACLATMTASPPPWLARLHPETLPQKADGTRLWPGARQAYCPSSPIYREHAAKLVGQVASRYHDHPALALWHINNEYGCHTRACYCDVSAADFRDWLKNRYQDINALNDAWSTKFWSQRYDSFDEILPPRTAPTFANPTQQLDFARFSSDALLECFRAEKAVIRRYSDKPVTTNHVPVAKTLDLYKWGKEVDVVSYDSYPDPFDEKAHVLAGLSYDLIRSTRDGQPWMLMEQAPSAVNWRERNAIKAPGQMRLWSWQAIAHGADAVLYFQWRQSQGGAEKFHSGMVPHAGPDSRTFREVSALGAELKQHKEILGTRPDNQVALVLDWDNWWALELDSHPSTALTQMDALLSHYTPLFEANIGCDVVHPDTDLGKYKLVVVPNLYLTKDAENFKNYVRDGGHLLMSFFSGIVDGNDRVHLGGYPAPFRDLLGIRIPEFRPLQDDITVEILGEQATGTLWSEEIEPETAAVKGSFDFGPALTRNEFGNGVAWYLGTRLDEAAMRTLMNEVVTGAAVTPVLSGLPDGVQAARRGDFVIVLNHNTYEVEVRKA